MAARVKVEYVHLGQNGTEDQYNINLVKHFISALAMINVATTATTTNQRPAAPDSLDHVTTPVYARITVLDNPVYIAWGDDPTASDTTGILVQAGAIECLPMDKQGTLLSFKALA